MEQYLPEHMQLSGAASGTCFEDDGIDFLNSIPPGHRFIPTDEELIEEYLKKKINDEPFPYNLIRDVAFYHKDPTQLVAEYEPITENEWYFFTPRDKKYPNGSRPNRATPNGYWKPTGKDTAIPRGSLHPIGKKRTLDFYEGKHNQGRRSVWKMHEYRVEGNNNHTSQNNGGPRSDMTLDDWVLCKLYKNQRCGGNEASTSGGGIQSPRVNVALYNEAANSTVGSSNFEYEDQPTVYVPQINEASLMVENMNMVVEDQPAVNVHNNEAYLMAGNMGIVSEYQNVALYNEAAANSMTGSSNFEYEDQAIVHVPQDNEASLMAGNISMVLENQPAINVHNNETYLMAGNMAMVSEYQNLNASLATPYQRLMYPQPLNLQSASITNPPAIYQSAAENYSRGHIVDSFRIIKF